MSVSEEKVIFRITSDNQLNIEYKGKTGSACVEEVNKLRQFIGSHTVTDEGHTDDYYKSPAVQEVNRWTGA